jgi:uncharacterized membrane protein
MMDTHDPMRAATDALATASPRVAPPSPAARAQAIATVTRAIALRITRRRRRRVFFLAASAAAAVALVLAGAVLRGRFAHAEVGVCAHVEGAVQVHRAGGGDRALGEGGALASGDRVDVPADAHAVLSLSTGTTIALDPQSDFEIVAVGAQQVFALDHGSASFEVAKLRPGERFVVRAADVEVEVRGTSFELSVVPADPTCGGGTTTRLVVSEGLVLVRNAGVETNVGAGDVWPRGCGKAAANEVPEPAPTAVTPNVAPAPKAALAPDGAPTTAKEIAASELAAQNDLFAQATGKKNAGDVAGAVAGYERYLAKYPGGPLAESATVERMRLLASIDPGRGAVAAKAYLARYPNGFDRAEAERLASGAP